MALNMQYIDFNVPANGVQRIDISGSFFRIVSCLGNVSIKPDSATTLGPITAGQGAKDQPFSNLTLKDMSGQANSGTLIIASAEFIDINVFGNIAVTNTKGPLTNADLALTNAVGGVLVSPANGARRYALLQNNDAIAKLRITFDGSAPSATHGIKVMPGSYWESPPGFAPTGPVKVWADQAAAVADWVEG